VHAVHAILCVLIINLYAIVSATIPHCIPDNYHYVIITVLYICRANKFTHDQKEQLEKAVTERNSKEGMTKLELDI
jgi:hypothetical protein